MIYEIGDLRLDAARFSLSNEGTPIPLEPKPLRLLLYLAARHPAGATRQQLLHALWPGEQVTDSSLSRAVHVLRAALGPETRALVETVRGHGYRLDASVKRVASDPRSPQPDPFVGRRQEMIELRAMLEGAVAGHGRTAIICGEPGIGKTRLAREVSDIAKIQGFDVLWARAHEYGDARALWPWSQILESLVQRQGLSTVVALAGEHGAMLGSLLPELGDPSFAAIRGESNDRAARVRLFDEIDRLIRLAARDRPILAVLDDIDRADDDSISLFNFVASSIRRARAVVLATSRKDDATESRFADSLGPAGEPAASRACWVRLGGLEPSEARQVIRAYRGEDVPEGMATGWVERAAGNPLFLRELARSPEEPALPRGVTAAVDRRLALLPTRTREVLEAASVAGDDFDPVLLATSRAADWAEIRAMIGDARVAHWVEPVDEAPGAWRFVHDLLREAVYDGVSPTRKAALHMAWADTVENHGPRRQRAARVALHLARGARSRDELRRAASWVERAADESSAQLAFEGAVRLYDTALEFLTRIDKGGSTRAFSMRLRKAVALDRLGRSPEGDQVRWELLREASGRRLPGLVIASAIGIVQRASTRSKSAEAVHSLDEAILTLAGVPDTSALVSLALSLRVMAGYWVSPQADSTEMAERALRGARASGNRLAMREALKTRQWTLAASPDTHGELEVTNERLRTALDSGDLVDEAYSRFNLASIAIELGDSNGFEHQLRLCEAVAGRLRYHFDLRSEVLDARSTQALWRGKVKAAEALNRRYRVVGSRHDPELSAARAGLKLFSIRRAHDRAPELLGGLMNTAEQLLHSPERSLVNTNLALALLDAGKTDESHLVFSDLGRNGFDGVPRTPMYLVELAGLAELAARHRCGAECDELFRLLLPWAGRCVHASTTIALGSVDRRLALLSHARGDGKGAEQLFESALLIEERMGSAMDEALTRFDYASMLIDRAAPGDQVIAFEQAGRAREICDRLGAPCRS